MNEHLLGGLLKSSLNYAVFKLLCSCNIISMCDRVRLFIQANHEFIISHHKYRLTLAGFANIYVNICFLELSDNNNIANSYWAVNMFITISW